MVRAVIYCRVSTKEQAKNLSLPTQQRACVAYCRQHGIEVDRIFVEEGESAKTAHRPEFQQLIPYCRENKGRVQYLVVYAINRFARDKYDHYVVRALLHKYGVTLRSVTEPIDDSSTGKLMEGVLAAFAQFDNDVRAERTAAGMKATLEKGQWTFQPPLGYLKPPKANGSPSLVPDATHGSLVQQAFELYATGRYTKREVLARITALGLRTRSGKKLSPQSFSSMLRNPIYAGRVVVSEWGVAQRGDFQPVVTEETFNKVQALLVGRRPLMTPHLRNHPDFPLRRFVRCSRCTKPLTGSWSRGRSKRYAYYRCPNAKCCGVNIRTRDLERRFLSLLERLRPKPEYVALFKAVVLDVWRQKQGDIVRVKANHEKRIEGIRERKGRLVEAFVYQKVIDKETYQDQLDRLNEEMTLAQLEQHESQLEALDVEAVLEFAEHAILDAPRLWTEFSSEQKQRFQRVLFPEGLEFDGESFGTGAVCFMFSYLRKIQSETEGMVAPTGFEPVFLD